MANTASTTEAGDQVPDGALLQLPVRDGPWGPWAEGIPPAPAGAHATVLFSSEQAEAEHGEALTLLGYQVLGVLPRRATADLPATADLSATADLPATADLLVTRTDLERYGTWFRSLLAQSERAFDLSLGPVLVALGDRWRPHLQAARAGT